MSFGWQRGLFAPKESSWTNSLSALTALIEFARRLSHISRAQPVPSSRSDHCVAALLYHSDRGSQYTSDKFQRLMADHGITCSMSRSGNVWDNAAMESCFSSLKTERIARKVYRARDEARADVFDYMEHFCNSKRRHSTIGYLSPMEFEMNAGFA